MALFRPYNEVFCRDFSFQLQIGLTSYSWVIKQSWGNQIIPHSDKAQKAENWAAA